MSEELRQKGYLNGKAKGAPVGEYEGFNLGATTLNQLRKAGILPKQSFGKGTAKPDGLVVDRLKDTPEVKLIIEYKDYGVLRSASSRQAVFDKVVADYCLPLNCSLATISDYENVSWILVDTEKGTWRVIEREDGYPLETPPALVTDEERDLVARTLKRLQTELNVNTATLEPLEAVNPTRLAEQTWQIVWLASGDNPRACLATFVEILIFKFLSDLKILTTNASGVDVDFQTVLALPTDKILRYYFEFVRPEIKRLFPPGDDGTSVINGIILKKENLDHGRLFSQILAKFFDFGPLHRIDPEFKSRIFERFLKKTVIQRYWGQYFTPRNVVKAMVEMSGIEHLTSGSVVADPASGVGGFLLEPLVHKRPYDFRVDEAPSLNYRGWDRDSDTIILAKANMLIHLSEVLEGNPSKVSEQLAPILNETFHSVATSITGTLASAPRNEFDLMMTNPPYVVKGTGTYRAMIAEDAKLASYYSIPGAGVENLFIQLAINGLKPGARALIVVPDGLLLRHTEESLKRHLLNTCQLEAIISLPKDTFYSTPKKTYILVFRKKLIPGGLQEEPVFTYLVGAVGETLDAKRFTITENDLPRMTETFRLFQGAPSVFTPPTDELRLKIWPIQKFKPEDHWMVDRWWTEEELRVLGAFEGTETISPEDLSERLRQVAGTLSELADVVTEQRHFTTTGEKTKTVSLADKSLFRLSIGKRVLKQELFGLPEGPIPLYSANVTEPFGYVYESFIDSLRLIDGFTYPSVLWGIDGDFMLSVKEAEVPFAFTDHCGRIEILDPNLDASYCRASIALARVHGFDRTLRPSLTRMKLLSFDVPVREDGSFDLEAQKTLASRYDSVVETLKEAGSAFVGLADLEPDVMLSDHEQEAT